MKSGILILPVFLFVFLHNIHGFDFKITSKSAEGILNIESNNNFKILSEITAIGELELNQLFLFRGGISLGIFAENLELKTFASAKASPFINNTKARFLSPFDFTLAWYYNGLFAYEVHSNSIYTFASYNWKRAGISLGYNFRFTSFLGEEAILEATPIYSFCFKFVNNDSFYTGLAWGNLSEFNTRNITDYTYDFFFHIRINDNWKIISNIEFLQSGAIAYTETLYGVRFKTGVRYTW